MRYKDYIELGFKRFDMKDSVEFDNTGYPGYVLEKHINKKMMVCVNAGELEEPVLFIKKRHSDIQYSRFKITPEAVEDLFKKD